MYYSPKTSTDGLVFHYDTGNTVRSYLGEPTTNVLLNTNLDTGWSKDYQNNIIIGDPYPKPLGITSQAVSFTSPNSYGYWYSYGDYAPQADNTTYSVSIWARTIGSNFTIEPYTADNSESHRFWMGGKQVIGNGEWQRLTWNNAFTTPSNNDSDSLSFYLSSMSTSQRFWLLAPQLEPKSHVTPFVAGTRSATQGLKDLTAKNSIDIGSVSFDSNAQMTFDGTDDFIPLGNLGTIGSAYAIECVFNSTSVASYRNVFDMNYNTYSGVTGNTGPRLEQTTGQGINFIWSGVTNNNGLYNYTNIISISANRNYHVVFVQDGSTGKLYLDGTLRDSANNAQGYLQTFGDAAIGRGFTLDPSRYFSGGVYVFKIYKKALTADEVQRNFNAVKSRFNIA
jgi:hypothetical protein